MSFSPEQSGAIRHGDGPALVIAGPGSGKTAVLTNRIRYLIEEKGISPEQILTITFSKAAALQMRQRFDSLCEDKHYPVRFGTFHSIFFEIIHRQYRYNTGDIATLKQKREYMRTALARTGICPDAENELIDGLLKDVAYYKNRNENVTVESDTNIGEKDFARIYRAYRDIQIAAHKIDFEDMLLMVRNLFVKHEDVLETYRRRYRYILIDEYQDINDIQFDIVRMLAAPLNNIFAVGDDDQSIYGFRGSRSELMLGFTDFYPNSCKIELAVNYRCADKIIEAAGKVIACNKERFDKRIRGTDRSEGIAMLLAFEGREKEDEWIEDLLRQKAGSERETAVFLRTNREASRYAEICRNAGIECDMKEAVYNPYNSMAYKDIYHYLWLAEYVENELDKSGERRDAMSGRMAQMIRMERLQSVQEIKPPVVQLFPVMNKPLRYLNRRNILCDTVSIDGLKDIYCDKTYMEKVLDSFAGELLNMTDMDMYSRVNYIRRGIGYDEYVMNNVAQNKDAYDEYMETADWIQERVRHFRDVSELDRYASQYEEIMAMDADDDDKSPASSDNGCIRIMTYHASKGLEFDSVILPHLNEGSVPHKKSTGDIQTEEERRMFYVAMTRAKEELYMTYVSGTSGDKEHKCMPSRFILPLMEK